MATQLSTSAVTASALFTNGIFRIPPFQREYSWGEDEIKDLCNDLKNGMKKESYFLGLVILIGKDENYTVVDGQQRLTTLSLLAIALCREAERASRESLARSIRNNFLYKIDYETDQEKPRLNFTDPEDNATYTSLLSGDVHEDVSKSNANSKLLVAYGQIQKYIRNTIRNNAWQQLGEWTKFLDNKVYFATFTHPDENAAYQVFEVINTRGRELTTADLLKNRLLSQIQSTHHQNEVYARWQDVAKSFRQDGSNTFVQYIRHVVTLTSGHVLPKDLYNFLVSDENNLRDRNRPNLDILLNDLEEHLENYLQMIEPARTEELQKRAIYLALNDLNVVAVRPILLAILNCHDCIQGMDRILKFVVRRVVVGSLGTGNVERILSEAARRIWQEKKWEPAVFDLEKKLEQSKDDFVEQVRKRQYGKRLLEFLLRSLMEQKITPVKHGSVRYLTDYIKNHELVEPDGADWQKTLGNAFLTPIGIQVPSGDWPKVISTFSERQIVDFSENVAKCANWDAVAVKTRGLEKANELAEIWYS